MLDKQSTEILKFIKHNGITNIEQIRCEFGNDDSIGNCVSHLRDNGYIKGLTPRYTQSGFSSVENLRFETIYISPYQITPKGIAYLEEIEALDNKTKWENIHKWSNTVIAALAFLAAIPALILSIMQLMNK